jgi:LysR family cyn operon transcriptional activator
MALLHRKASLGRWAMVAWDPQRFLAPYAKQFVEDLRAFVATISRNPS